jgi:hypothetical protein
MSKTVVLTLELSDNINMNNIVDGFNEVIGKNLEYVNHWEWMNV